jgi:hypothetical protein
VYVTTKLFQRNLMFMRKAGAYPNGAPKRRVGSWP